MSLEVEHQLSAEYTHILGLRFLIITD